MLLNRVYILLLFAILSLNSKSIAQNPAQYNLNYYTGLPSDNVYCMLRDRYGYLWIGTEKGVVKYNGYQLKTFTESSGLTDPDVWDFFEDRLGRMWLSRISNEFGYLYNEQYHEVYREAGTPHTVYPTNIRQVNNKIVFLSPYRAKIYLCTVINDTLRCSVLVDYSTGGNCFITADGSILNYYSTGTLSELDNIKKYEPPFSFSVKYKVRKESKSAMLRNHIILYPVERRDSIVLINTKNYTQSRLDIHIDDPVYNQYTNKEKSYIVTSDQVYIFDSTITSFTTKRFDRYLSNQQIDNNKVAYIIEDSLWGNCIATTKKGCFFSYDLSYLKKIGNHDLSKYEYVGATDNETYYWWNDEYKLLAILQPDMAIEYLHMNNLKKIEHITDYDSTEVLIFTQTATVLMNKKSRRISSLYKDVRYSKINSQTNTAYARELIPINRKENSLLVNGVCGIRDENGQIHCVSRGIGYYTIKLSDDTVVFDIRNIERYKKILYTKMFNKHILYNTNVISIASNNSLIHITKRVLNLYGINRIDGIIVDNQYGNIFINGTDNILLYNYHLKKIKRLYQEYQLKQAQVITTDSTLVVASKGGVLFSKIYGLGKISPPVFYPNVKASVYNNLYSISAVGKKVILNTDSGLFEVDIPQISTHKKNDRNTAYRIVIKSSNGQHIIAQDDTVVLKPDEKSLVFDVINPAGVGKPTFEAFIQGIDNKLQILRSEELLLKDIVAGNYYNMHLKVSDDIWVSPDITLTLYRAPTFWQTSKGKALTWFLILLVVATLLYIVIFYTRKIVSARHIRKNYLQSLELKAIYAQINPHFIFNTLNTGLYYISENKNKDAYTHISSFSELLRSYIKSSRNTYTTLADEIENLEHYIRLQKNRFENRFDYSIFVDDSIHATDILIPSLLLQPFVENAINHGLLHKKGTGYLDVKFISENPENEIICVIEDNGIGRKQSQYINQNNPDKPNSYGNTLITDLVQLINTEGKLHLSIKYIDKTSPQTGTTVIITIRMVHHDRRIQLHNNRR